MAFELAPGGCGVNRGQGLVLALAEGYRYSAPALAARLGVSANAVRRYVARLQRAGWPIDSCHGAGYTLDGPGAPLDPTRIESGIEAVREAVNRIEVWPAVASTQGIIGARAVPDDGRAIIGVADQQNAGYGRQGRAWRAPRGGAITLSVARWMPQPPVALGPLAPGLGLAVARTIHGLGGRAARVKWPNDVLIGDAKVAGVLIDVAGVADRGARVVVGVGANYAHDGSEAQPGSADLCQTLERPVGRSDCTAALIRAVIEGLQLMARSGPEGLLEGWDAWDAYEGCTVEVTTPRGHVKGVAAGVGVDGALQIDTDEGRRRFSTGEVSLRGTAG